MDEREGKRVLPADVVELALSLSAVAGGEVDRWDGRTTPPRSIPLTAVASPPPLLFPGEGTTLSNNGMILFAYPLSPFRGFDIFGRVLRRFQ